MWNDPPPPLLWPVGPCASLEISPVPALAHHTPHLGVLLKRDTEAPETCLGGPAWVGCLASSCGCYIQGPSRPRPGVGPL